MVVAVVEFPVQGGGTVLVNVAPEYADEVVTRDLRGAGATQRAKQSFESALDTIRTVADSVLGQVSELARHPHEVKVEFGLELTAKTGAVLATAGSTAHLRVELT
ncbi:CU044_2847 family protein [Dactylosporangium cerinum]|uniref:CU044_2847 family protein n=1 Tax=Dactylosporangium cerinum TaxID=1434730 RepID=A0ABV9WDH4_9ACTN